MLVVQLSHWGHCERSAAICRIFDFLSFILFCPQLFMGGCGFLLRIYGTPKFSGAVTRPLE
jgi:hypothetical protein